jgi:hypothetical protein
VLQSQESIVKVNRGALKLCGVYTGFFVLFVGLGYVSDLEGQAFLHGLAVFPVLLLLANSGLREFMEPYLFMKSVWVFFPICLVILYFIGWAISGIGHLITSRFVRQPPAPIGDDPPDWRPR